MQAMGIAYKELLASDRDYLMLQHQSYAACDDEVVCACVRRRYAELIELARELSGADAGAPERVLLARHGAQRRRRARGRGSVGPTAPGFKLSLEPRRRGSEGG